jgi:perosamine synthetase
MIPVNEPLLVGNEKKYVMECLESGWISSEGSFVKKFETDMATYVDRKYAVAVSNGTCALEAALVAIEVGAGDEVILPTFTIISCANAIIKAGASPVLVDCNADTFNMTASLIEAKITSKTKAILVVHTYGLPCDMDAILELAKKYNLKVIEDSAEMLGQEYKNKRCGSFGDISILSFYANKIVTTGEGGMILTNDLKLAERCRSLRNLCFKTEKRFSHDEMGSNFRMTNVQAAIGCAQLEQIDKAIEKKRWIGETYKKYLSQAQRLKFSIDLPYAKNIYWVFPIVIEEALEMNADELAKSLKQAGIDTRPFFWCMHEQPVFKNMGLFKGESYINSERLARKGLYLPSGLAITEEQISEVSEALLKSIS